MAASLVEINGIAKSFGDQVALRDVTFAIPPGQICGLLGRNGAGKTTLFRLVMGILKATRGTIRIDGLDAFKDRVDVKRLVGFVPDEPIFYAYLSGREMLELSAAMHGLDVDATMARLEPLAKRLRLGDELDQAADDASRGVKKKLALLLALLHRPKLLLLDEPANGLDVEATHLLYEIIREQKDQGTTVLFSTHVLDRLQPLCTRVVIIDQGRVITDDAPDALQAAHEGASMEDVFLEITDRPAVK